MKAWLTAVLLLAALPAGADCVDATGALRGMARGEVVLHGPAGEAVKLEARVADEARERSAGFQHICPDVVARTAIYFEFARPRRPSFHMHNVKAPLDIAFIDGGGAVVDIQRMEPYVAGAARQVYYSPPTPVAAALEARAGFFAEHGIHAGGWRVAVRQLEEEQ